jgi:hypothetical protein
MTVPSDKQLPAGSVVVAGRGNGTHNGTGESPA